ncbi:TPA: hypothetical protein JZG41_004153 [Escherichia coli]|nr:hypothetical protein [Escherichia coli]
MTKQRDLQQITTHQHCRQYPLDGHLAISICKMSAAQANHIRDISLKELQQQEYVSREEFSYITGRTHKAVGNILDRNDSLVHREYTTPDAKRPKRYVKLQRYWATIINNKASLTPQEQKFINEIQNQPEHHKKLMKQNIKFRKSKEQNPQTFRSQHTIHGRIHATM